MKEIKDIIAAYEVERQAGRATALATVVHVDGSAYRRPGARMLVTMEGKLTGAISGGCLEGDALRKALYVMNQQKSLLVTYDTTEDDSGLGAGLGCEGTIHVLIEPVDYANPHNAVALLMLASARRQDAVLITLFCMDDARSPQPGTVFLAAGNNRWPVPGAPLSDLPGLSNDADKVLRARTSLFHNYTDNTDKDRQLTAFIEFIAPAVSLVIIGAGSDTIPMAALASTLGWDTTLINGRANYSTAKQLPASCQVMFTAEEAALQKLSVDAQTVFVLMTHNYRQDLSMLKLLLPKRPAYIGLLGPKKKYDRMVAELRDGGTLVSDETLEAVYGPAGLDIGAETPAEIAMSIVAEIRAVLSAREGRSLKYKPETIHSRKVRSTGHGNGNDLP